MDCASLFLQGPDEGEEDFELALERRVAMNSRAAQ
jgi:hypothetical protein